MLFDATLESWGEWTLEDCVIQSCAGTALRLAFDGRSLIDHWFVPWLFFTKVMSIALSHIAPLSFLFWWVSPRVQSISLLTSVPLSCLWMSSVVGGQGRREQRARIAVEAHHCSCVTMVDSALTLTGHWVPSSALKLTHQASGFLLLPCMESVQQCTLALLSHFCCARPHCAFLWHVCVCVPIASDVGAVLVQRQLCGD